MNDRRIVTAEKRETVFEGLTTADLDNLERRTTAFLYALWVAMGERKKIIRVESSNGHYEEMEMVKDG